jgi:hypothetical protein
MRIKATDEPEMAAVMVAVLQFARTEPEDFVFGPFERVPLLRDGLSVEGDIERLITFIEGEFPGIVITDG